MKENQTDTRSTYQTGSTNPPKSHYGTIAVLLIVIIVLSSAVTISGMMNFRLFNESDSQEDSYEPQEQIVQVDSLPQAAAFEADLPVLGLTCEEIDNLYRIYHRLPQGLYISHIEPGSDAQQAGLLAGDVVIACDDTAITKKDRFLDYVNQLDDGTVIQLTVFRDNQQFTISLTV